MPKRENRTCCGHAEIGENVVIFGAYRALMNARRSLFTRLLGAIAHSMRGAAACEDLASERYCNCTLNAPLKRTPHNTAVPLLRPSAQPASRGYKGRNYRRRDKFWMNSCQKMASVRHYRLG
jgi:hypothetical protein